MAVTFGRVPQYGYVDRFIASKREGFGWNNLGKRQLKFVTLHRMVGTLRGTDSYFRQPNISSYTDFGLSTKLSDPGLTPGTIYLWNYPTGIRSPWASGPVSRPYGDGKAIVDKYGINAVNRDGISLEIGGTNEPIDEAAWKEIVWFVAYWADQLRVPWTSFPINPATGISFVIWHNEFTDGTGKQCPFMWLRNETPRLIQDVKAMLKFYQEGEAKPDPKPTPGTIGVGVWVEFTANLNVRVEPSLRDVAWNGKENKIATLPKGTKAKIIAGPKVQDGHTWWDMESPGFGTGWVSGTYLTVSTAPAPAPEPEKKWKSPSVVPALANVDPDTVGDIKINNGTNFRPVFDTVKAVRQGKQRLYAIDGDNVDVVGPDYKKDDVFEAMFRFTNDAGTEYLLLSNWARVLFDDFVRVKD